MKSIDFYFLTWVCISTSYVVVPENWYSLSLLLIHGVDQIPVFAKIWEHC